MSSSARLSNANASSSFWSLHRRSIEMFNLLAVEELFVAKSEEDVVEANPVVLEGISLIPSLPELFILLEILFGKLNDPGDSTKEDGLVNTNAPVFLDRSSRAIIETIHGRYDGKDVTTWPEWRLGMFLQIGLYNLEQF